MAKALKVADIITPPPPALQQTDAGAVTDGAAYSLTLPLVATDPIIIRHPDGHTLTMRPRELYYHDEHGELDPIVDSAPVSVTTGTHHARYERLYPLSDDTYATEPERIKHYTSLYRPPRAPAAYLSGHVEFGMSWSVECRNSAGEVVPFPAGEADSLSVGPFTFPQPHADDLSYSEQEPERRTLGHYEVVDTDEGQVLFSWFDAAWFADPDRRYPVTVDPTVSTSTSSSATYNQFIRRRVAKFSDGTLFAAYATSTGMMCAYRNPGEDEWRTPIEGATVWDTAADGSVDIADDDVIRFVIDAGSGYFLRGVWNANRDGFVWSQPVQIAGSSMKAIALDTFRETSGRILWITIVYSAVASSTSVASLYIRRCFEDANGNLIAGSQETIVQYTNSTISMQPSVLIDEGGYVHVFEHHGGAGTYYFRSLNSLNADVALTWADLVQAHYDAQGAFANIGRSHPVSLGANVIFWAVTNTESDMSLRKVFICRFESGTNVTGYDVFFVGGTLPAMGVVGEVLVVVYVGTAGLCYRKIEDGGATIGQEVVIDADVTANYPNMALLGDGAAIDIIYTSGSASPYTVKHYRITLNEAPLEPTIDAPPAFDASDGLTLVVHHNDPDPGDVVSGVYLKIGDQWWDGTGIVANKPGAPLPAGSNDVQLHIGGIWTVGQTYQLYAATVDAAGVEGPFNSVATVVKASVKPTATITAPTSGAVIPYSYIEVEATQTVASGVAPGSYTVAVYDEAGTVLHSETRESTGALYARLNYEVPNGLAGQLGVTPTDSDGLSGDEVKVPFTVAYTPPAIPTVAATIGELGGYVEIAVQNGTPTELEPAVAYNDIYRRQVGSTAWMRIATQIAPDTAYRDYEAASKKPYEYMVKAIGENGTVTSSAVVTATADIPYGVWMHDPFDPSTAHFFEHYDANFQDSSKANAGDFMFAGRTYPVTQFSPRAMERPIKLRISMLKDSDDLAALESLFTRRTSLCLRDARGRKLYGTIKELPITDEKWGATADVDFTVVDYKEGR